MSAKEGIIVKALSGFYYVETHDGMITCRGRGKLRLDGTTPLVGDRVILDPVSGRTGTVREILPRRNRFIRPAVANIDLMVMVAAAVNPVTDPFLIDRVWALAEYHDCGFLLCINKTDLDPADRLWEMYRSAGADVIRTSAVTSKGLTELAGSAVGKTCAFIGNSGVGKSSLLNALDPSLSLRTAEVSRALGRGRHTTRHVELFSLAGDARIADTPGFGSFDLEEMESIRPDQLQFCFPEFAPYLGKCRFRDCTHRREPGCAVLEAVESGKIGRSRHGSYERLWVEAAAVPEWERT